jgi:hypothetical protein
MKKLLISLFSILICANANAENIAEKFISDFDTSKAEYLIKFGGWSHHGNTLTKKIIKKYQNKDFKYNQNHSGIGIEYSLPYKDSNHYFTSGFWYMKDSFGMDAFHAGAGYKYRYDLGLRFLDSVDFNLVLTYFNRSRIHSENSYFSIIGVDKNGSQTEKLHHLNKLITVERTQFILPAPYITLNITKNINIDLMAIVTPAQYDDLKNNKVVTYKTYESVFFVRAGFTF